MVPRYARPAMTALWEPEAKFRIWFEIEAHATQKLGEMGVVPESAVVASQIVKPHPMPVLTHSSQHVHHVSIASSHATPKRSWTTFGMVAPLLSVATAQRTSISKPQTPTTTSS